MNEQTETTPIDWKEGARYKATLAEDVNHKGLTVTTFAAHLMIERAEDGFSTRLVAFGEKSKRSADGLLNFSRDELLTALGLPREADSTDRRFAESVEAEFALPGKFARKGGVLAVFCKAEDGTERRYYFVIPDEIKPALSLYLNHR
ncbi:MAG: hypothetical protein HZA81_02830 [Candidatus Taylorbacteria bacterium]|nr:hypothetical protein [Candidatus Taylorbacteria bacterium]